LPSVPIGAIILFLTALGVGFTLLYTHSKPFHDFINSIPQLIQHGLGAALDWLKNNWKEALFVLLTGPIGLTYEFLKHFGPTILSHISSAVSGVLDWLKANWKEALLLAVMGPFGLILAAFKFLPAHGRTRQGTQSVASSPASRTRRVISPMP
jgi:hypothetical protein